MGSFFARSFKQENQYETSTCRIKCIFKDLFFTRLWKFTVYKKFQCCHSLSRYIPTHAENIYIKVRTLICIYSCLLCEINFHQCSGFKRIELNNFSNCIKQVQTIHQRNHDDVVSFGDTTLPRSPKASPTTFDRNSSARSSRSSTKSGRKRTLPQIPAKVETKIKNTKKSHRSHSLALFPLQSKRTPLSHETFHFCTCFTPLV